MHHRVAARHRGQAGHTPDVTVRLPGVETMAAAVYRGPGDLAVEDRPIPRPGPDEVLIEVEHCGICGSDLHMVLEGWGRAGSIEGHEYAGRVVELGSAVDDFAIGDRVVGGPSPRCGRCRHCLAGRPSLCSERDTPGLAPWQGAFARYKALPAAQALPVPEGLDPRAAALAEPLAVALHAIGQAGLVGGERVLVFGAGPIGALAVAALRALGHDDVRVCEPGPLRRALAERVGATWIGGPEDLEVPSIADPGRVVEDPVDAALECSGHSSAMEAGLAQLERGGRLVLVGAGMHYPTFDSNRIVLNELVITGSFTYAEDGFSAALDLLASGRLPLDALIEPQDVGLGGLLAAMRSLAGGETAGKVMVDPRLEVAADA